MEKASKRSNAIPAKLDSVDYDMLKEYSERYGFSFTDFTGTVLSAAIVYLKNGNKETLITKIESLKDAARTARQLRNRITGQQVQISHLQNKVRELEQALQQVSHQQEKS